MKDLLNKLDTETRELVRLQKHYDKIGDKYFKKWEKLRDKEDAEMWNIWNAILKQQQVVDNLHLKKGA
tara:strand:+ start:1097 stop:1300 length:204 start_codon:yes stop_codon:yes gene_type:complete